MTSQNSTELSIVTSQTSTVPHEGLSDLVPRHRVPVWCLVAEDRVTVGPCNITAQYSITGWHCDTTTRCRVTVGLPNISACHRLTGGPAKCHKVVLTVTSGLQTASQQGFVVSRPDTATVGRCITTDLQSIGAGLCEVATASQWDCVTP